MDPDMENKIMNKVQCRALIVRVYHYFMAEYKYTVKRKRCNCDISHMSVFKQRTADACGVSLSTVQHILDTEPHAPDYKFNFKVANTNNKNKTVSKDDDDSDDSDDSGVNEYEVPLIEIDYGEPVAKKSRTEPAIKQEILEVDIKKEKEETERSGKKLVDYIDFEVDIKQERDIEEEVSPRDEEQEICDSITIKTECIM